ncbi:MAG: aldo/keto reductase [Nitrospinota bacterium]|nr:aldo/keto reductase [Nitrospinota bacterium]MDP6482270.1 aldo/keto reductase [Nitrospinota bacterium]MDP6619456.1 aldo/keto reductase [Nitrospinota bacterium]HJM42632.1 aldo/keto reductase [Nitrospinota bacterium]
MRYRTLGRTGLDVSVICLGTMQFGWTADEPASFRILDAYLEAGGNFLDTADIYSYWSSKSYAGKTEEILGRWIADRKNRDRFILATKVEGRMWDGPDGEGLGRAHVLRAVEDSLRRLRTDHIDLYQTHRPDPDTSHEETLDVMDRLVREGKVRHIGCSNYSAGDLRESLSVSRAKGCVRFESHQPYYNLGGRAEFEEALLGLCGEEEIGVIPYSPLAGGFLTGKYRRDEKPADSDRMTDIRMRYLDDRGYGIVEKSEEIGRSRGVSTAAVSLGWLLSRAAVTAPIIGANSVEQLRESLQAGDLVLSPEEVAELDRVSAPA